MKPGILIARLSPAITTQPALAKIKKKPIKVTAIDSYSFLSEERIGQ